MGYIYTYIFIPGSIPYTYIAMHSSRRHIYMYMCVCVCVYIHIIYICIYILKTWQPTPVFLPGESHGQRSLVDYSPWGRKESDMTEVTEHTCTHIYICSQSYFNICTHTHTHTYIYIYISLMLCVKADYI